MKLIQILLLTLIFCLFATSAYAYIDPGTGSLIIQLVIGALAAASLFFKNFWLRVKSIFSSSSDSSISPDNPTASQKTSDPNTSENITPKKDISSP